MRRIFLAIHLPFFRLERCGWDPRIPAVLIAPERGAERVQCLSLPAGRAGVRLGMTLSEAKALLPEIRAERLDPVGELADLEALAGALIRFTPAIRAVPPDAVLLEVGTSRIRAVRMCLGELGHAARLVSAEEPESALMIARHAARDRIIPAGGLKAALAPLPVQALGLPEPVLLSLLDVGISTVEQFAAFPPAALSGRYGPEIVAMHARAGGRAPALGLQMVALPMTTAQDDSSFHVDFPDPVDALDALLFVVNGLVRDLCRMLERTGRAAVRVQVMLRLEEGVHRVAIRFGQPARGPDRIFRLLRARLDAVQIASPAIGVGLELLDAVPFRAVQPGLLDRAGAPEPLPELCARLQDSLGSDAVCTVAPVDSHRPESAWQVIPWGDAPSAAAPAPKDDPALPHEPLALDRPRPALLLPAPVPLRVAAAPSGRPRALLLEGVWIPLGAAEGPERLRGDWWQAGGWCRDYWRVDLPDGRRAWIYRQALPGDGDAEILSQRWYLHGWMDADDTDPALPAGVPAAATGQTPGAAAPRAAAPRAAAPRAAAPRWAELICRSNYSFCEGASFPEELAERAVELGLAALALTDRDGVYGSVRFHRAAKALPALRALHGSLLTVCAEGGDASDAEPCSIVALVSSVEGWGSLCRLLTVARGNAEKGTAKLPIGRLLAENAGLILLAHGGWAPHPLAALREAAGDRLYRAVSRRLAPGEEGHISALCRGDVPCVATGDVLMHDRGRAQLQDVLTCIRLGITLDQAGRRLQPNHERVLKEPARMARLFGAWPGLVERTVEIADRCDFSMNELRYCYPREVVPEGYSAIGWLRELVRRGARERYGPRAPSAVARQIEYELAVIERLEFAAYFLTVHDIVRFARARGILCQGRGSAANSAVCYVLGVTAVDPAHSNLLFERFISEERGEPPDIDIDFEHERREEVLQYVYEKYGRDRAAMVNEVICWRGRMAVRDVGKAVGLGLDQVDRLAKGMEHWGGGPLSTERIREAGLDPADPALAITQDIAGRIQGFPRHTSIHVGGFVISDGPLIDRAPVEPATMEGRTVIQWDKNDIDDLGFVKVDLLSLGMLTAIRKCFELMRAFHGVHHDLASVPREDPAVYDLLCEADSTGVFQVESRAQQGMLPRLKPRKFYDLVIETAIVRPGPIQGGMVHPYLRRRAGLEPVTYVDERLRPILDRTLGVPIFQEQVMAMAVAVGNFTAGEADALRRAMGAWRRRGTLGELGEKLMTGMRDNGIPAEYAEQIFKQIQGFAEYGFPESHAASFAHLVYVSAWQRCHYPAAFCAALINSQPMGFYAPRSLVADAQRHGVEVREVDARHSGWDCSLEPGRDGAALRLGLRLVKGLGEEEGRAVEVARRTGPFTTIPDFSLRTRLPRRSLLGLARAGALDALLPPGASGESRIREAVWTVEGLWSGLFAALPRADEQDIPIRPPTQMEALQADFFATGLSVRRHPVGLVRSRLDREGVTPLARLIELPSGASVRVAGLVSHRQRPGTASGVLFMTLEDETGTVNVVVWPKLYERQRSVVRREPLVRIAGVLQREGEAMSVVARHFRPLDDAPKVSASSRDFR